MKYYEYGGMKRRQNTKSHICNDNGIVLCGVKSNWMEAGQEITGDLFVRGSEYLFPITDKRHLTCKKCLKKYFQNNLHLTKIALSLYHHGKKKIHKRANINAGSLLETRL